MKQSLSMNSRLKILSVFTTLAVGALFGVPAHAMTVSPVMFEKEIAPGASVQDSIRLINDSNQEKTYVLSAQNFTASGENGAQQYLEEERLTDLASWVHANGASVTIPAGGSADVPFTISIPQDAEPGGHYATIFFSQSAGGASSGSGVGISQQVGVLLLVSVPGNVIEQASVDSFRLLNGSSMDHLPAIFELRVKNSGSVHIHPEGNVVVKNMLGNVVARIPANPKHSAVLPNSIRRMDTSWEKAGIRQGGFFAQVENEWRNFGLGRYTASVDTTYGSKGAALSGSAVTFWIFPWRLAIVFLIAIFILILLMRGYNGMVVKAAMKKKAKVRSVR